MESERLRARRLIKALFKIDEVYFKNEQNLNLTGSELCLLYALDDGEWQPKEEFFSLQSPETP